MAGRFEEQKRKFHCVTACVQGKWIHCIHMACLRNRDRPPSKQFPEVLALGDAAFDFKFEDSELLEKMIGDDTREKYPDKGSHQSRKDKK